MSKVRSVVNVRCRGASKPGIVFTDRGKGFYVPVTGKMTEEYARALHTHGFQAFMKSDASAQPGELQDMMLHETAASWLNFLMVKSTPKHPEDETVEELGERLKEAARYINEHYDVAGLCKELPQRARALKAVKGD
eukprot:10553652-Karenia_brevis.AAC.1